ncbi:GDSL esterase/lipase [Hibiscus syriacus]|uniref:GDSL esterase/lipase n=1 Tax=Hibiscus syriacus TaxID=106335 RepID=A0A6A2XM37_HIBSY|nr:GDSL esterase/lipase [Hibiscus syriacus]
MVLASLTVIFGCIATVAEARAFFIFGDSLVDIGNNNYLQTIARADSPSYGIDYLMGQPTGRKQIGLSESSLPYLSPDFNGKKLLVGANLASAGVGILNDTGVQFLELFQEYERRLSALVGSKQAHQLVSQALVLITVGGNDFVNNYYLVPFSARSRQYSLPDYVLFLISEYRELLTKLYKLGAQRVLVTGTGPLVCVSAELATRGNNCGCSQELQRAASLYNPQLAQMINEVNAVIGKDAFISANTQRMHNDFVSDPQAFGT